ncbi:MAG: hypothetical protein HKP58_06815 [Desulfatitalea sp.]|nr:hypothetical protein [Desulfatitalea sp.]NNK00108.1 hypothetical protein [Desulfatitalea sp.]
MTQKLALTLTVLVLMVGCAGHKHRPHGEKLSEAMEKSSDTHTGERVIETPHGGPHSSAHETSKTPETGCLPPFLFSTGAVNEGRETKEVSVPETALPEPIEQDDVEPIPKSTAEPSEADSLVVSLGGGLGFFLQDDFYPMNHVDLSLGWYLSEKSRLELYLGFGWAQVFNSETLKEAIDGGIHQYGMGLRYKYYTTPRHTFLGHYFLAGFGLHTMYWSYRNTLFVDGRSVKSDHISGVELFVGTGIHLVQTDHFQFGIEAAPSFTAWGFHTHEGFENDVFDNPLMLKLRLTASYIR